MGDGRAGWKSLRDTGTKGGWSFLEGVPARRHCLPMTDGDRLDSACPKPQSSVLTQEHCLDGMHAMGREIHTWVLQLQDRSGVSPTLGRI